MTKKQLIEAMADFPEDMEVYHQTSVSGREFEVKDVTEICPTGTDTSENYLLIS